MDIRVNKVANPSLKKRDQDSRNLPKMPRLYLELLENKDKVKQNLVNKEYDPDDASSDITFFDNQQQPAAQQVASLSDISEGEDESMHESEQHSESAGETHDGESDATGSQSGHEAHADSENY